MQSDFTQPQLHSSFGPPMPNSENDPIFMEEQEHLSATYQKLKEMETLLNTRLTKAQEEAAADKLSMSEELSTNFATYADAMETYADFAAMNRVIDGYNRAQEANTNQLAKVHQLLKQPYFAKIALQFKPDEQAKELYIGTTGISDESYRRMIVDWRSPVAEVYYNQVNGQTSYRADGRTIHVDLKLRRQFDLRENHLNAYFDTSVAIQDSLLLASLSKQRTAQMQDITATIQKEQNKVIRHEDVDVLLVSGIAGSGKTSILLQRVAYLFYQNRENLGPEQVVIITPNKVFQHYINDVLPDLGEQNPPMMTFGEFAQPLLAAAGGIGRTNIDIRLLQHIDRATSSFNFEPHDFKDVRTLDRRLISADQINKIAQKFHNIPAGPHKVTLIREELFKRLQSRLKQMAGSDEVQEELSLLDINEQVQLFHQSIELDDEQEVKKWALQYLNKRYANAYEQIRTDSWLRIDRIGMRLLNSQGLPPLAWLYLKMAISGMGDSQVRYVIIDEVQDYSLAQLALIARYFRRAHFLLLGDPNQAIAEGTASYEEVRKLFSAQRNSVEQSFLMTSYRSSPEITDLFASLLSPEERMRISSIQRADTAPSIRSFEKTEEYEAALRNTVEAARDNDCLTAVIVPWKHEAQLLQKFLGKSTPTLIDEDGTIPTKGLVIVPLKLAKGLEFDYVIIPDASARIFPDKPLARRRLYTTISRATGRISILARGKLTPLLKDHSQNGYR